MLVSCTEVVDAARRMRLNGVAGELYIDWPDLIAFKRTFTDPVPKNRERTYAEKGIDAFTGKARFAGRNPMTEPKWSDITLVFDQTSLNSRNAIVSIKT
jgi:glutathione reductase (NADPH)